MSQAASWRSSSEVSVPAPGGGGTLLPLLRDGIECPLELRHPKRQQVAADRSRSALIPDEPSGRRTFRPAAAMNSLTCGGRARERVPGGPTRNRCGFPGCRWSEEGDRYALGFGDRQRAGQVIAVAVIKGHDHSWPTRRNRRIGERRGSRDLDICSRWAAKLPGRAQRWKGSSTLPRPGGSRESAFRCASSQRPPKCRSWFDQPGAAAIVCWQMRLDAIYRLPLHAHLLVTQFYLPVVGGQEQLTQDDPPGSGPAGSPAANSLMRPWA